MADKRKKKLIDVAVQRSPISKALETNSALKDISKALESNFALRDLITPTSTALKRFQEQLSGATSMIRAMETQTRMYKQLVESPILEQIRRDNERFKTILGSINIETNLRIAPLVTTIDKFAGFARTFENSAKLAQARLDIAQLTVTTATLRIPGRLEELNLGTNHLFASLANAHKFHANLENLANSVSMRMLRELSVPDLSFEESVAIVEEVIRDDVPSRQVSLISLEGWLSIIFAMFLYIAAQHHSAESEERILDAMDQVAAHLTERFDQLELDSSDSYDYFVVTSNLNVRSEPNTRTKAIDLIHSNQKVKLIKQEGRWFYVEYFDYLDEIPKSGWVYKRYLKKLPTEN